MFVVWIKRVVALKLVALVAVLLMLPAPMAAQAHDAFMPLDSRHPSLMNVGWVTSHQSPIDEDELAKELALKPGQLQAYLYDDHHTLAQLATTKGIELEGLLERLTAWSASLTPEQQAVVKQRARLVLVGGHLAQHLFFHVYHGNIVMSSPTSPGFKASKLSWKKYREARIAGRSIDQIVKSAGGDIAKVTAEYKTALTAQNQQAVAAGETPQSQASRMTSREIAQLRCFMKNKRKGLDKSPAYGNLVLGHKPHTAKQVPKTVAQQKKEERRIERYRKRQKRGCYSYPDRWTGTAGKPLSRAALRAFGGMNGDYTGSLIAMRNEPASAHH